MNRNIGVLCCSIGVALIAVALIYIVKIAYLIYSAPGKVSLDQSTTNSLSITFPVMILAGVVLLIFGVRKLKQS